MEYYARKNKEKAAQTIKEHLSNVAKIASTFSKMPFMARLAAILHDIGKFLIDFKIIYLMEAKEGISFTRYKVFFFLLVCRCTVSWIC